MDELARVLVTIFDAKHLLSPLLWNMFYREVEVSDCMQTLFRGNSLGSKIMAFCFKVIFRLQYFIDFYRNHFTNLFISSRFMEQIICIIC